RFHGVTDERRERVTLRDQVFRDRGGRSVQDEPGGDPFGPIVAPPHALALGIVEAALEHRRSGRPGCGLRSADVVGVEVGDRDLLRLHGAPGPVRAPEARVEQRPAREIAVHVLRAGRQGEGEPPDTVFELYERLFYTPL